MGRFLSRETIFLLLARVRSFLVVRRWILPPLLFLAFLRLLAVPLIGTDYSYREGDIAGEMIRAPFDIVSTDVEKTEFKKQETRKTISPVFVHRAGMPAKAAAAVERAMQVFGAAALQDDVNGARSFTEKTGLPLAPGALRTLVRSYGLPMLGENLALAARLLAEGHYFDRNRGYFSDFEQYGIVLIRDGREEKLNPVGMADALFSPLDERVLSRWLARQRPGLPEEYRREITALAARLVEPNCTFDTERSAIRERAILSELAPVTRLLKKDEVVVREGDRITPQQHQMIQDLNRQAKRFSLLEMLGLVLFSGLLFWVVFRHLAMYHAVSRGEGLPKIYIISAFLLLNLVVAVLAGRERLVLDGLPVGVFVPVVLSSLSLSILLGERVALFATGLFAYAVQLVTRADAFSFALVAGMGLVAVQHSRMVTRRTDLWKAGLVSFLVSFLCLAALLMIRRADPSTLLIGSVLLFGNCMLSAIATVGLLPVFERLFDLPTRFSLVELADQSGGLLRELLFTAPGTFAHSMSVGSLASSAAEAIGADALLARVGGYYHDIGKIERPMYYIENQRDENPHDGLNPSVSRAILVSHVRAGVKLARKHGLPQAVVSFIEQHHGTSLIRYFYSKAGDRQAGEVNRELYRYPGPRPRTRETAIVMLADIVEAASRNMENPNQSRVDKLVRGLLRQQLEEGELDDSPLTLQDLAGIRFSFTQVLSGIHHRRVAYPEGRRKKP
jgi:putative nucleotidyltransferase with HDIG domain